jgi:hypothetical protein
MQHSAEYRFKSISGQWTLQPTYCMLNGNDGWISSARTLPPSDRRRRGKTSPSEQQKRQNRYLFCTGNQIIKLFRTWPYSNWWFTVQWYTAPQARWCSGSFFLVSWGGVKLSPLGTSATNWPTVPVPDDRRWLVQSVEWELAGETEILGENLPQCQSNHHKSHMTWPGPRCSGNILLYGCVPFESWPDYPDRVLSRVPIVPPKLTPTHQLQVLPACFLSNP